MSICQQLQNSPLLLHSQKQFIIPEPFQSQYISRQTLWNSGLDSHCLHILLPLPHQYPQDHHCSVTAHIFACFLIYAMGFSDGLWTYKFIPSCRLAVNFIVLRPWRSCTGCRGHLLQWRNLLGCRCQIYDSWVKIALVGCYAAAEVLTLRRDWVIGPTCATALRSVASSLVCHWYH